MKKFLLFALLLTTFITSAFADVSEVSYQVLKNFNANYREASNVTWTTTKDYSKAEFILDDHKMEVFYKVNGDLIGSSTTITYKELPQAVIKKLAKKMIGYTFKDAIRFECPEEYCYYVSIENDQATVIYKADNFGLLTPFKTIKK